MFTWHNKYDQININKYMEPPDCVCVHFSMCVSVSSSSQYVCVCVLDHVNDVCVCVCHGEHSSVIHKTHTVFATIAIPASHNSFILFPYRSLLPLYPHTSPALLTPSSPPFFSLSPPYRCSTVYQYYFRL